MEKKFKFNIIDILVIAVVIIGIVFVGMKLVGGNDTDNAGSANSGEVATYHVTFSAESIPAFVGDHLVVGSKAENDVGNVDLGTLISFTTAESINYVTLDSGEIVQTSKPNYISCELVCELTGQDIGVGLLVGEHELNVGHAMKVRTGNAEISVYVKDIQPVAGE